MASSNQVVREDRKCTHVVACFLAVCREGQSAQSFGFAQWYFRQGGAIIPLPTAVLSDVTEMGLCHVVSMIGYDPVLSLMAIRRTN